jgi:hypothetical protein
MSTVTILQTLLGIINSRKNKFNPTGPVSAAASSDPTQTSVALPVNPAVDPLNPANVPLSPSPDGSNNPGLLHGGVPQPSPYTSPQSGPQTEDGLRQQLQQADLYDLSGEKAAAEALKRDDAFKQQQIDQKAEQTKEFFAQQDQKQQQTLQEVKQQADQQQHEQQEKEFWDQKKSMEMQAGMNKELLGLHEAARQTHQEWRNDFTQGICRDDVAALYNKDITDRVGQYKARLDDMGTNPVDAVQTIDKYKVKLTNEVAPQVDQKTAELHQEHFPEFRGGPEQSPNKGFGPFEGTKPGEFWPGPQSKPGDFWPGGGDKYPLPNDDFFKPLSKDNNPIDRSGEQVRPQAEIIPPETPAPAPKPEPPTIDGVAKHVPETLALPKPQTTQGSGDGGNGGGGDSDKPAAKPNSSDVEDDSAYHALRVRQKLEDQSELHQADVLRAEHPLIANGVAAVSEAVDPDFAVINEFNRHPDKIYGDGEKEFEEHEKNPVYGRKGAESAEALEKGADAAWEPTGETVEHMNDHRFEELHAKAEAGTHHDSPNPSSPNPGSDSPSPTQSTGATTGGQEGAATGYHAMVQDNKGDLSESIWTHTHTPADLITQAAVMGTMGAVFIKHKYGEAIGDFADKATVAASELGDRAMNAAGDAMDRASGAVDAAVGRAKELAADVQVIAEQASDKALDATQNAMDRVSGTVDAAVDSAKEFGANVQQKWEDSAPARQKMANEIRETGKKFWADESGSMDMNVATGGLAGVIEKKLGQQEIPAPSSASALSGQDAELVRMLQARAEDLGTKYTGPKPEEFANSIAQKNQESPAPQLSGPKETLQIPDQKGPAPDPGPAQPAPVAPAVQPAKPQGPSL